MIQLKLSDLYRIADGLNIEGGDPYRRIKTDRKNGPKFIWANLILVLDRPLVDNVVFTDIWNDNRYPLLENRIDKLNEHHFMAAILMILQFYIKNCRRLLDKKEKDQIKITVHLHQDPTRIDLCKIINKHLCMLIDIPKNVELEYITDTPIYNQTTTNYTDTDILISLSQCAGLSPKYEPGTLHIADTFAPYNVDGFIHVSKQYKVKNDLINRLPSILKSDFNIQSVMYINRYYKSYNPEKSKDSAHILSKKDFIRSIILQVDKLWNPTNKNQSVIID